MKTFILVSLQLALLVVGLQCQPALAIVGGSNVFDTDPIAKTVVAVYDRQQRFLCTGVVLSYQLVLTAANCTNQMDPKSMLLLFGTKVSVAGGPATMVRQVVDLRINPRYEEVVSALDQDTTIDPETMKDWGDLALLKFTGGLPPSFHPAQLLPGNQGLRNGLTVTIAGYGDADANRRLGAGQLRREDIILADIAFAKTEMIMDQRQGLGACHGDSGGPAFMTLNGVLYLFGINSRGIKDSRNVCAGFSVYSSISAQMAYISKTSSELVAAPIPVAPTTQQPPTSTQDETKTP